MMPTTPAPATTVLIVEDHSFVRAGLRVLLDRNTDLPVCGEAETLAEARRLVAELRPGLVLLDLKMPDGDGMDLLEELRKGPDPPAVVVFTGVFEADCPLAERAFRLGARGFVNKANPPDDLAGILMRAAGTPPGVRRATGDD